MVFEFILSHFLFMYVLPLSVLFVVEIVSIILTLIHVIFPTFFSSWSSL